MIFDSKLGDCYETVIAALAQHIDHLNMEISFKEQAISRLQRDLDAALADKSKLQEEADKAATLDSASMKGPYIFSTPSNSLTKEEIDNFLSAIHLNEQHISKEEQ